MDHLKHLKAWRKCAAIARAVKRWVKQREKINRELRQIRERTFGMIVRVVRVVRG